MTSRSSPSSACPSEGCGDAAEAVRRGRPHTQRERSAGGRAPSTCRQVAHACALDAIRILPPPAPAPAARYPLAARRALHARHRSQRTKARPLHPLTPGWPMTTSHPAPRAARGYRTTGPRSGGTACCPASCGTCLASTRAASCWVRAPRRAPPARANRSLSNAALGSTASALLCGAPTRAAARRPAARPIPAAAASLVAASSRRRAPAAPQIRPRPPHPYARPRRPHGDARPCTPWEGARDRARRHGAGRPHGARLSAGGRRRSGCVGRRGAPQAARAWPP